MIKVLIIFGTRPEAIKFAPLIKEFQKNKSKFHTIVCVTAQHRQMLDQILEFFRIIPDYDLNLMKPDQDLAILTTEILLSVKNIILSEKPDLVFVQGDTTTAFAGALASFYQQIRIAHLEAGLRSFNKYAPFPEEINRRIVTALADYHFTPTNISQENLQSEGIPANIYVVGNTVVDALQLGLETIRKNKELVLSKGLNSIDPKKDIILITSHRRENFGSPILNICLAIRSLAIKNQHVQFVYPVHLNPNIRKHVFDVLSGYSNIHLLNPLDYASFIYLMNNSKIILTDSGGVQEEALSLGKPVLVMREVTERMEGINVGGAKLIGTYAEKIIKECQLLIDDQIQFQSMIVKENPYGDGKTAHRIIEILKANFKCVE